MKSFLKTLLLLFLADMQKEFQNLDLILGKVSFKPIDLAISSFPNFLGNEFVHPHDQNIFVLRTIEDADRAFFRYCLVNTPKEVVGQLFAIWYLKRGHRTALRTDTGHHVANGSVFASSIHALQNDQKCAFFFGVEQILQIIEALEGFLELVLSFVVVFVAQSISGGKFSELDFLVRRDD